MGTDRVERIERGFVKYLVVTVAPELVDVAELVYEELDWEGTQEWERKVVPDVVLHDIPRMVREFEENRRIMVREIRVPDGWKARTELEIRRVMGTAT